MIATTIEQSKKLLELGLSPKTADMNWHSFDTVGPFLRAFPYVLDNGGTEGIMPAWSLFSLQEITKVCNRCECNLRVDKKWNVFATCGNLAFRSFELKPEGYETLFDGIYHLVEWLLENDFIIKNK